MALIHPLSYKEFDVRVRASSIPVVVHFGTPQCDPCREFVPVLEEIAEWFENNAAFFSIDLDADPQALLDYHIQSIPAAIVFRGGLETERASGGIAIVDMLEKLAIELYKQAHYH